MKVTNKDGVFLLQVGYTDANGASQSQGLAYGISTEFNAQLSTTVTLSAFLGGSQLRQLTSDLCAKGEVNIDCTGPTIWNFACSQPYNF